MEEFEKEFLKYAYLHIFHYCLVNHKITKYDTEDTIKKAIAENIEEIAENMRYSVNYYVELKAGIEAELKMGRNKTAILLVGTYIEHQLNSYYLDVFEVNYGMSKSDIENALKSPSLIDKITWLYKLVNCSDFDIDLINWIKQVNSIRNKMVHYKPFGKGNEEIINDKFDETVSHALIDVMNRLNKFTDFIEISKSNLIYGLDNSKDLASRIFG